MYIKLQELDYSGTYCDRTSYVCAAEIVAGASYKSSSVTCAGALEGTFRTFARGYARPDGVQTTRTGYPAGVCDCVGY